MKKLIAFTLSLITLTAMAGCSQKDSDSSTVTETPTITQTMYKEERLSLPDDFSWYDSMVYDEEHRLRLFYYDNNMKNRAVAYDEKYQPGKIIDLGLPEGESINSVARDLDGNILVFSVSTVIPNAETAEPGSSEYFDGAETFFKVYRFNLELELIEECDLGDLDGNFDTGTDHIDGFYPYKDSFIISLGSRALLVDKNGSVNSSAELGQLGFFASDSKDRLFYCDMNSYSADCEFKTQDDKSVFENGLSLQRPPIPGDSRFALYLIMSDGLYGLTENYQIVQIVSFESSMITASDVNSICPLDNGKFAMLGSGDSGAYLSLLTARPDGYVESRETVIVGIHNAINTSDYDMATEFAKLNDKYSIQFRGYDWESDDLLKDILSDNAPDVYEFDGIHELYNYVNMGAFMEIDELSAEYGGFSSGDLMPNLTEALKYKGGLYAVPDRFRVTFMLANRDVIGREFSAWNLDEFFGIAEKYPQMVLGTHYTFRDPYDIFSYLCIFNLNEWVDFESAECYFDSQKFTKVLEFCRDANIFEKYPDEYYNDENERQRVLDAEEDAHLLAEKKALLFTPMEISGLDDFVEYAAENSLTLDEVTFLNSPNKHAKGNLKPDRMYSVLRNGKCRQGGWEFMNYVISHDRPAMEWYSGFPSMKDTFETVLKRQAELMNQNEKEIESGINGYMFTYDQHISEEQVEYIKELILSCAELTGWHDSICAILQEEFNSFINGETSAEDCSKMMQSRVEIYLSEQQ